MKKYFIVAGAIAALVVPSVASAATGVSTNGTTQDAVGFCISAGNYNIKNTNIHAGYETRGEWNRALAHGDFGAPYDGVKNAIDASAVCQPGTPQTPYDAPSQP